MKYRALSLYPFARSVPGAPQNNVPARILGFTCRNGCIVKLPGFIFKSFGNFCGDMKSRLDLAGCIPDLPGLRSDIHFDVASLHILRPTCKSNVVTRGDDACALIEFNPGRFETHVLVLQNAASGAAIRIRFRVIR